MSKIKINLSNGVSVEKPLVTCFKGTNGNFIVFDNETTGTSGYPIICISKFTGSGCEKIVDTAEWGSVKENLKSIISGTALPYLDVPDVLSAGEDFFTQLTLPVASFDFLKNNYKPLSNEAPVSALEPAAEVAPVEATPVEPAGPTLPSSEVIAPVAIPVSSSIEVPVTPSVSEPIAPSNASIVDEVVPVPAEVVTPAVAMPEPISAPSIDAVAEPMISPVVLPGSTSDAPIEISPIVETPVISPAMDVASATTNNQKTLSEDEIKELKDNFMKSCENMFDALIKKFQN